MDFNNNMFHMQMVEENIRRNNELLHDINRRNEEQIRAIKGERKKGLFGKLFKR